ncbi:hypothetical protein DL93DRAFT_2143869 [Clavulina sp. PMI_390]|nr:hypothetical protein DL93DRAFT_2143869 [Clavulina sp. PMI_390]
MLIAAQPVLDILNMVEIAPQLPNVSVLFMDALPNQSTKNDIHQYITHMLEGPPLNPTLEQLDQLSKKAQLSFQWASTACLYIVDQDDGNQAVDPNARLIMVLSSFNHPENQVTLYNLYSTLMDAQFGRSKPEDLELLRLLLGVLVEARQPLSLTGMLQLLQMHLSDYGEIQAVKEKATREIKLLSSLVAGTSNSTLNAPLLPLHTSLFDFLQDYTNNPKYCVDVPTTHKVLTESCFAVMESGERRLRFNICQLPTSFLPNLSIPELPGLIDNYIGETLAYACNFWASHFVASTNAAPKTLNAVKALLATPHFLYWLEVMSLTGASPAAALSLVVAQPISSITAFAAEALLFATYFAIPIALSTPHIYLSAVPFVPVLSPMHAVGEEYERTVMIPRGQLDKWPTLRHALKHQSGVCSVAVSQGGIVVAGLQNGAILLWDIQTGQMYGDPLKGHSDSVMCAVFSHDGTVLASCSSDGTIQLWDVQSQTPMGDPLMGHSGIVWSVAFSPDGAVLASGSEDETIQLWDVQSQTLKGDPLRGHSRSVKSVAFSPDGAVLVGEQVSMIMFGPRPESLDPRLTGSCSIRMADQRRPALSVQDSPTKFFFLDPAD